MMYNFGAVPSCQTQNRTKCTVKNTKNGVQCTTVRYASNKTLHEDSRITFVEDEIKRMTNRYLQNLTGHSNEQVRQLHVPPEARRRLNRQWTTDVLQ
jgi:hypothetical protein